MPLSVKQFAEKPNRFMPRTRVRLDKVVATQNYLDPAKVRDIASKPPGGPDPIAHYHKGCYYVGDGHHRVAGAIDRGDTHTWIKRSK